MRRLKESSTRESEPPAPQATLTIPHDPINEAAVLAAAAMDENVLRRLVRRVRADHFLVREHAVAWGVLEEVCRRGLHVEPHILEKLGGPDVATYVFGLVQAAHDHINVEWHVANLLWDAARANATRGPLHAFLEALREPKSEPDRVKSLAHALAQSFDGHQDRRYLRESGALVRSQMIEIEKRAGGLATFPYGIRGLDRYDDSDRARMIPGAAPGKVTVVTATSGSGKALALQTPIATHDGWKTMGTICTGDYVFDENGRPTRVVACSEVMFDRPCYEVVFSDGERIVADAEHLWRTTTYRERSITARRKIPRESSAHYFTAQMAGCRRRNEGVYAMIDERGSLHTTGELACTLDAGHGGLNHAVDVAKPLRLPEAILRIEPYLLGVWLGDGTSATGHYTSNDPEIADEIRSRGNKVVKTNTRMRWRVIDLQRDLRKSILLELKRIPPKYLRASFEQRLDLLRGLMDTDGCCSKNGSFNYDTTSEILKDDVWELMVSLGIKVRPHIRDAKLNGRIVGKSWRFVFTTELEVFTLPRKLVRAQRRRRGVHQKRYIVAANRVDSVPVRCIEVDSPTKLFLAGRQMVPTHNSTLTAHIALGIAGFSREGCDAFVADDKFRTVLFGAWEMESGITLELLACISLGWSRSELMEGRGPAATPLGRMQLEERMHLLSQRIRFMDNPFWKERGGKPSNERHLDLIHGYLADSGCEVFIADLWKRCLVDDAPSAEEHALIRQQAMLEELRVHGILLQQQRLKDIEMRADKRPSRDGIKGSGAWVEVADTILAPHRPALWKKMEDDKLEMFVLKQRYGKWPLGVEFDWNPDTGQVWGGRAIEYDRPGEMSEFDQSISAVAGKRSGRGFRRI